MVYLYRGIHARHPQRAAALNGVIVPGNVNGTVSPEEHNRGGRSADSPFTSWTVNRYAAEVHACNEGAPGLLLRVSDRLPADGDGWSWVASPDHYGEGEWLLRGIRIDAEVIERELPCTGDQSIES